MKILSLLIYFNLIIFITIKNNNIHCSNSVKNDIDKLEDKNIINNNDYNEFINQRKLSSMLCNLKYCIQCNNKNECIKCKDGYALIEDKCYSKNCEIFGFCKYCDEYDCLKCEKGYKLNYGVCAKKEISKKLLLLKICIPIIIVILIIYLCLYKIKKAKEKIETGQVIKFLHPKSGFYRINYEKFQTNSEEVQEFSQNKSLSSSNSDSEDKMSPEVKLCVVCGSKKTYTIADCGCSLCLDDYKIIKGEKERIKCRIHNVFLSSNISFEMYKSNIKGNAVEKLGLSKCPICKINDGTQGFNCGCPMRVCENCFNSNVYVLKYNQCPGCGMPYVPIKNTKKKKQSIDEKINK